jgi:hypothetical protein
MTNIVHAAAIIEVFLNAQMLYSSHYLVLKVNYDQILHISITVCVSVRA